jgi:membrane associated rhomboid family serine protease
MFPPGVKWLLIANAVAFVAFFLSYGTWLDTYFFRYLRLFPLDVIPGLKIWEPVTYLFLHAGFWHLFFNMIGLWMFGSDLERTWGTNRFLKFYFICGIGAGFCVVAADLIVGPRNIPTIGASGAIFGVLLAYGMLFPDNPIWIWFLFPVKAKYFVLGLGVITFLYLVRAQEGGVSHVAHLGGMLIGYLYLRKTRGLGGRRLDVLGALRQQYREWRMRRARRRFEVYMRKQDRDDRDRWVH